MNKIGGTILVVFLISLIGFMLWLAWIAPEKKRDLSANNTGQPTAENASSQAQKNASSTKPKDDFNPAGYWRYKFLEDEDWSYYRNFSQDGQYKWYTVQEPETYDGKWEWISDDQIKITSYTKKGFKSYSSILTVAKNEKGEYIMKENYNGNPIEWERYIKSD